MGQQDRLLTRISQDWLYDEGDDATKAVYISKIEEIRFVAGPVIQRYLDKVEEERQAVLEAQEKAAAAKRAEQEKKQAEEAAKAQTAQGGKDAEMTDADGAATVEADGVADA